MTEEEQQMAIAEFCGWREAFPRGKDPHPETKRGGILLPYHWVNERTHARVMDLPDYLHDLNAMHEAEERLSDSQLDDYRFHLMQITQRHPRWSITVDIALAIKADASQRAEALLRTIGKWVDSPSKSACQPAISGTTVLL